MTGEIILWATIAVFAIMAVAGLLDYLIPSWPKGKRLRASYEGYEVTFIYGKGTEKYFINHPQRVAELCAIASWSTSVAWMSKRTSGAPTANGFKKIIVHVLNDKDYDKTYDAFWGTQSNGMLKSWKIRRTTYPVVACRASAFKSTETDGNLVIHELTHWIIKQHKPDAKLPPFGDLDHAAFGFWHDTSPESLERVAHKRFLEAVNGE